MTINEQYELAIKIRTFEEKVLSLFGQNRLSGTTHTYIGEEATAVSMMNYVTDNDVVFSNHRCHGHYLAYGGPEKKLLAEIMSKESGLCQGRGGSQHIHYKNFYTNGIQGGIVPNALGVALAKKQNGEQGAAIVFIGDGTLGQGVVYESLNIAAIEKVPLLVVVEDNQYAMSTRRTDAISGDINTRIASFDIKTFEIESTNIVELNSFFEKVFKYINETRRPTCAIVHNYRLGAHSKGDDTRPSEEVNEFRKKDPLGLIRTTLGEEQFLGIQKKYRDYFDKLADDLEAEKNISIKDVFDKPIDSPCPSFFYSGSKRCVELIREAFDEALSSNKDIIIYGEDVCDPYGGAFKVTKGLSTKYPLNVLNMPISEACMVGMGVGLAMHGKIPVVEMMFADFVTLGFDQLLNHATKYDWVYGDTKVPLIVRLASGGKRGYGPTHSQSLEKYLIGIPLIRIIALSFLIDPGKIYKQLFHTIQSPTVVVENKKLYSEKVASIIDDRLNSFFVNEINHYGYPTIHLTLDNENTPDFYFVTYGGMVRDALDAAESLMIEEEIQANVIVLSQIAPLPYKDLSSIIKPGSKVVFIEEGSKTGGIGAEFIASCMEKGIGKDYYRIASFDVPIPNGIVLEQQMSPDKERIIERIKEIYYGK